MTTTKEAIAQSQALTHEFESTSRNYRPWQISTVTRHEFNKDFVFLTEGIGFQTEHLEDSSAALIEQSEKLNSDLKRKGY